MVYTIVVRNKRLPGRTIVSRSRQTIKGNQLIVILREIICCYNKQLPGRTIVVQNKQSTPPSSILNVFMIILKLFPSYGSNHHYFKYLLDQGYFSRPFSCDLSFTIYHSDDKRSLFNIVGNYRINAETTQT